MSIRTDFLVIGSGIAGLNFALLTARHGSVMTATKKKRADCATMKAQGGIAAATGGHDSFESHIKDTLEAGRGLCNREAVETMVKSAPKAIERLKEIGVEFDSGFGIEGGHSARRILHVKDWTGEAIEKALVKNAGKESNIQILEDSVAIDLILKGGRCLGATFFNERQGSFAVFSKVTVLASGGAGMVYSVTSNPGTATGDGIAIASRADCTVENMEFVQFHPTTLNIPGAPHFLLSEALRGEGAILLNGKGERFMKHVCPKAELAPRDVVTLAVAKEMSVGPVYLEMAHLDSGSVKKRFPCIYQKCLDHGIDMTQDPIPVTPAAHFMCGGVRTDANGRTNIAGLYAIGEVACTGVHGANRLASNSLLEGMVFSERAARDAGNLMDRGIETVEAGLPKTISHDGGALMKRIRTLMWERVGIIRNETNLKNALEQLDGMTEEIGKLCSDGINPELLELRNMAIVSRLIIEAALKRKESLGCHYIEQQD